MTTATEYRTAAQGAKIVRAEVKAAVAAGELPAVKYSVRSATFSQGQGVSVYMEMDDARAWRPTAAGEDLREVYGVEVTLTDEVRAAGRKLGEIAKRNGDNGRTFFVSAYLNGGTAI